MSNPSPRIMMPTVDVASRAFARNPAERNFLRDKHLVIVGVGSVGSAIALMGARAGVGRLTLIDPEELAPENICRHMCDLSSVGRPKVEAMADLIRRINPEAAVRPMAGDFRKIDWPALAGACGSDTVLVGATDSFLCQSLLNMRSLDAGIKAVYVGCWGEATMGEVLYVIPGETACYECYAGFRRETQYLPLDDPRKYTDPDFDETKLPGQAGLWPNILVICGFAFPLILALLGEKERGRQILDIAHPLFLVNVADFNSPLRPMAVTPATVRPGCGICDERRLRIL